MSRVSQQEDLTRTVRALSGIWDTQRAVTALRDAGHEFADQRPAEKQARRIMRDLKVAGLLFKLEEGRAVYRFQQSGDAEPPAPSS